MPSQTPRILGAQPRTLGVHLDQRHVCPIHRTKVIIFVSGLAKTSHLESSVRDQRRSRTLIVFGVSRWMEVKLSPHPVYLLLVYSRGGEPRRFHSQDFIPSLGEEVSEFRTQQPSV